MLRSILQRGLTAIPASSQKWTIPSLRFINVNARNRPSSISSPARYYRRPLNHSWLLGGSSGLTSNKPINALIPSHQLKLPLVAMFHSSKDSAKDGQHDSSSQGPQSNSFRDFILVIGGFVAIIFIGDELHTLFFGKEKCFYCGTDCDCKRKPGQTIIGSWFSKSDKKVHARKLSETDKAELMHNVPVLARGGLMKAVKAGDIDAARFTVNQCEAYSAQIWGDGLKGRDQQIYDLMLARKDFDRWDAAKIAAKRGDENMFELLIGDTSPVSHDIIYTAINGGNVNIVKRLVSSIEKDRDHYCDYNAFLKTAAKIGNKDMIKLLTPLSIANGRTGITAVNQQSFVDDDDDLMIIEDHYGRITKSSGWIYEDHGGRNHAYGEDKIKYHIHE